MAVCHKKPLKSAVHVSTVAEHVLLRGLVCCLGIASELTSVPAQPAVQVDGTAGARYAHTGHVFAMRDFPEGGVLIGAQKGLFLAHNVNGSIAVERAGNADTGTVFAMHDFPEGGVLIGAEKGWFVAHTVGRP